MIGASSVFKDSSALAFPSIPILPNGRSVGGILEQAEAIGGGLVKVTVSGMEYLVDESLQEDLEGLVGKQVAICRLQGKWGCGRLDP